MLTKLTKKELWIISSAFTDLQDDINNEAEESVSVEEHVEELMGQYTKDGIVLDTYLPGKNPFEEHKDDTISK